MDCLFLLNGFSFLKTLINGFHVFLAILALKEESASAQCAAPNAKPVLEEFIPLKKDCEEHEELNNNKNEKDSRDKKNWMSSVQLWNTDDGFPTSDTTKDLKQNSKTQTKVTENEKPNFEKNI